MHSNTDLSVYVKLTGKGFLKKLDKPDGGLVTRCQNCLSDNAISHAETN
jgi:hypothetical protein